MFAMFAMKDLRVEFKASIAFDHGAVCTTPPAACAGPSVAIRVPTRIASCTLDFPVA